MLLVFQVLDGSQPGEAGELSGGSAQKVYFALLALGHSVLFKALLRQFTSALTLCACRFII